MSCESLLSKLVCEQTTRYIVAYFVDILNPNSLAKADFEISKLPRSTLSRLFVSASQLVEYGRPSLLLKNLSIELSFYYAILREISELAKRITSLLQ
jgi:hypothetical protein